MTPKEIALQACTLRGAHHLDLRKITDEIFLIIENNVELMHQYLLEVEAKGVGYVNSNIGKAVKKNYDLTNANEREEHPSSSLIQSHQIFE
jgi:hypothetical protein